MNETGNFILTLMHGATNAHILHLQSKSYSEHMALGSFYEELPGLVDTLAESIQGLTGEIINYPADYYSPAESGLQEIMDLMDFVKENRIHLPQESEIQNQVDSIAELINSVAYKLRFLK